MDFTIKDQIYKDKGKQVCKVLYKDTLMCAKIYDFYPVSNQFYPVQEYNILLSLAYFENSLKIFGCSEYEDNLTKMKKFAILMEFCSNGNLDEYLAKRKKANLYFKEIQIWTHVKEFTVILRYLQRNGTSHRDIKPANILVTEDEKLKLSDFGEAKEGEYAKAHSLRGTFLYFSPKLLEAYSLHFNYGRIVVEHNVYKSDVFSLGLVFLSMVSLESFNEIEDRGKQINKKQKLLKNPILKRVLDCMIETEEKKRYDFEELGRIIEKVSQGQICWECAEVIDGPNYECSNCKVSFHRDCCVITQKQCFCRTCEKPLKDIEIEFLDPFEEFEISCSALKNCLICRADLIEVSNQLICTECGRGTCSICRTVHSQHSNCIQQNGFYCNCNCGNYCFYDSSLLFIDCPDCGTICRVCFEQDIAKSHFSCVKTLNIKLN